MEGFYYRPRIDHDILREHAKGLIGTTTCLGSEVNDSLLNGDYDKALGIARKYKEIFEEGCYFVELQDHRLEKQARCKEGLLRIAKELDLPLVATNDAHYLCKENYQAHDVLWCIGLGEQVDNPNRLRFENNDFYIKTKSEMEELFGDLPESLDNTLAMKEAVPRDRVLVTESGILGPADVKRMRDANVHAFLVGEAFMRAADPGAALASLFA